MDPNTKMQLVKDLEEILRRHEINEFFDNENYIPESIIANYLFKCLDNFVDTYNEYQTYVGLYQ